MLDQAAPDQRQLGKRAVQRPFPGGCKIIAYQPRQKARQVGELVAHLRRVVDSVSQDLPEIPGKHIRKDRGTFDQPGISMARLFAGEFVPIDQNDVPSPLLQMQGGADADHPRTQHEDVGL
jgi:hypothetical protein